MKKTNLVLWIAMTEATGFICSTTIKAMERHIKSGEWDKPSNQRIANFLHARLETGDCPRDQAIVPIKLEETFAKYVNIVGKQGARRLLHIMFESQSAIKPEDGGHTSPVLATKLETLAKNHNIEDELVKLR